MKENKEPCKKSRKYTQNCPDKMEPAELSIFQEEKPQVAEYNNFQKKKP